MENNSSASRKSELEVLLKWLSDAATPGPWNPNPKRLEIPLSNGSTAYGPIMSYMVGCAESQDGMKVSLGSERTADHKFVAALVNAYRSGELVTRSESTRIPDGKVLVPISLTMGPALLAKERAKTDTLPEETRRDALPDCMMGPSEPCQGYQRLLAQHADLQLQIARALDNRDPSLLSASGCSESAKLQVTQQMADAANGLEGWGCFTVEDLQELVDAMHAAADSSTRSAQLSGIAARVAKVERSSTPPEARALPEWAKDLESCWAEWTGGHISDSAFARCVSEIVTQHIIPAGYPTPDSIPVADILRQIEHIRANAMSLASYAGQKEEARCRELCALYLHDFIVNHKLAGYVTFGRSGEATQAEEVIGERLARELLQEAVDLFGESDACQTPPTDAWSWYESARHFLGDKK